MKSLEFFGVFFGAIGIAIVASNIGHNFLGFLLCLVSNIFLIIVFFRARLYGVVALQCFFSATSIIGMINA